MLGVLPAWQGRDIGRRLKLAQRDALIAQGFADWATWTFDPLLRPNARLNIHRLGGTSSTYLRDVYGAMADDLNAGLPSDRLLVDWHVRSARVVHALAPARRDPPWGDLARMSTSRTTAGRLAPGGLPAPEGAPVGLPLPEDVAGIRRDDMGLLAEWRLALRAAFEALFAAGYTLADVAPIAGGPQGSDHYILTPPGYRAGVPWP
jgi:predicted GNAT superfamily acetyltransferase